MPWGFEFALAKLFVINCLHTHQTVQIDLGLPWPVWRLALCRTSDGPREVYMIYAPGQQHLAARPHGRGGGVQARMN